MSKAFLVHDFNRRIEMFSPEALDPNRNPLSDLGSGIYWFVDIEDVSDWIEHFVEMDVPIVAEGKVHQATIVVCGPSCEELVFTHRGEPDARQPRRVLFREDAELQLDFEACSRDGIL